MVEVIRTAGSLTTSVDEPLGASGTWVRISAPGADEVDSVCAALGIDRDDLLAALDPEEKTRVQVEDGYALVLMDVPVRERRHGEDTYNTVPLGIILCEHVVVTVCSQDTPLLAPFTAGAVRGFATWKRLAFAYQVALRCSVYYQQVLATVDRRRQVLEKRIEDVVRESDLVSLHELESTLVYLATSLRGNANVLTRLARYDRAHQAADELDILDDAVVENQQAIEMALIYRDVIHGTRELLSSVMDLRLNDVMQRLTSITIIMAIPTIVSGLYGMNVRLDFMPLALAEHGFALICVATALICVVIAVYLRRKRLL